jgi:hypothetical protein
MIKIFLKHKYLIKYVKIFLTKNQLLKNIIYL